MFISRLLQVIEKYDPFGENRINGFKAMYLFILLCLFYFFFNITKPYFYYFYVPITAFSAELLGITLKKKYQYLIIAIFGSAISIYIFNILLPLREFFIVFVFFYSIGLYYFVLHTNRHLRTIVAIVLSLAAYSLLYSANNNYNYINALNYFVYSMAAGLIMVVGLLLLPKKCYFYNWRKAFIFTLLDLDAIAESIFLDNKNPPSSLGIMMMQKYSNMISKKDNFFSVAKITLLTFDLVMYQSYLLAFKKNIPIEYVQIYRRYLKLLQAACRLKKPLFLKNKENLELSHTHELRMIKKVIQSWNYLCLLKS
ncbi:MAG: hypothetical protein A3F18_05540 [Legionellales bacterium RIFCSPHIGHO2_12_FULL_37_14]|nr:MAG: hypothetical protein A3F18_05540 [Legionellales bacterium RIFCSPHIGHO2_12_FULL_37_14]